MYRNTKENILLSKIKLKLYAVIQELRSINFKNEKKKKYSKK